MKLELLALRYLKRKGYYIDNLWHISDVQDKFECTKEKAFEILDEAVSGEYIIEDINDRIYLFAKELGLKNKE